MSDGHGLSPKKSEFSSPCDFFLGCMSILSEDPGVARCQLLQYIYFQIWVCSLLETGLLPKYPKIDDTRKFVTIRIFQISILIMLDGRYYTKFGVTNIVHLVLKYIQTHNKFSNNPNSLHRTYYHDLFIIYEEGFNVNDTTGNPLHLPQDQQCNKVSFYTTNVKII